VSAFDAAGNVSPPSTPVIANTLAEPDVSPPSVPQNLASTSRGMTKIVLAWSASHDNVGVAGYEVYRNGALIANVPRPGYTDQGLAPATKYRYTVRAYDTSNNASADSNVAAPTTLVAPDTTPPTAPTGVSAEGTSPTSIDVSWMPSSDNVGVALYRVFRNGLGIAQVAGTAYTDQGLAPATTYRYSVRAVDAEGNVSGSSATVPASTLDLPPTTTPPPPPTTTPPPTVDPPVVQSVTLITSITDCVVSIQASVVVSAPMDVTLTYTITGGGSDSIPLQFAEGESERTVTLPDGDGLVTGSAHVTAGGESDTYDWNACEPPPPPTTDPPPPDEGGDG
jgi:chitodextrinase